MDDTGLTHIAAIVVGVVITLLIVRLSSKKSPEGTASSGEQSSSNSKNQKKKKKKKAKGAATSPTAANEKDPVTPEDAPTLEEEASAATAKKEKQEEAAVKKKKKKGKNKGSGNASKPANGAAANGTNGNAKENEAKTDNAPAPAPKAAPAPVVDDWQPADAPPPQEEEWNDVPVNKKKQRRPKPKVVTISADTPAPTTATDSVSVDAKKIGIIIGPKGATMIAIQEATGCQLDINAPPKDDPKADPTAGVVIIGPDKESIAKAKKAINELATKGYATLLQSDGFGEFSISVHPRYLSEIVGPGGKVIQALQKTLDVKLTIPPTEWKPNQVQVGKVNMCRVGIAGSKENSKIAKQAIQSLMDYHHHEVTHPGMIHEEIYVPNEFFHCVIGPRGSEIKHIRGNYKVDMYMPNEDSITENVLVVGKQANVDKAISYIQLLMDRDSESRENKYTDEYYD